MPRSSTSPAVVAVAVFALAASFTIAPSVVGISSFDDAAYAKNGNGNGGGGNGKGNSGAKSKAKSKAKAGSSGGSTKTRGKSASKLENKVRGIFGLKKKPVRTKTVATKKKQTEEVAPETLVEVEPAPLRADQKGRWNALNANQRARDVHIEKLKFNGTQGMLAAYQVVGKANAGEELTESEQRALEYLLGDVSGPEVTDGDLEAHLNGGDGENPPVYVVVDGVAECVENCDGAPDGNEAIASYLEEQEAEAQETAIADLFEETEQGMLDASNRPTEGIEDQLLDELADGLGFARPEVEEPMPDDEELETAEVVE